MGYIVAILRKETLWRICSWISLSCALATFGMCIEVSLCILAMPFFEADAYLARAGFMLIAHLLALAVPQRILRNLSREYGTAPPIHFTLSVVAWIFIGNPVVFLFAFTLIHLALWAEVVGVYWQKRLA